MPAFGHFRSGSDSPESGCSCLVVAFLAGLIVAVGLVALGLYATGVTEGGWQTK